MTMMIYHDKQESSKPEVPMAQDIWRRTLPDNQDTPWLDNNDHTKLRWWW